MALLHFANCEVLRRIPGRRQKELEQGPLRALHVRGSHLLEVRALIGCLPGSVTAYTQALLQGGKVGYRRGNKAPKWMSLSFAGLSCSRLTTDIEGLGSRILSG